MQAPLAEGAPAPPSFDAAAASGPTKGVISTGKPIAAADSLPRGGVTDAVVRSSESEASASTAESGGGGGGGGDAAAAVAADTIGEDGGRTAREESKHVSQENDSEKKGTVRIVERLVQLGYASSKKAGYKMIDAGQVTYQKKRTKNGNLLVLADEKDIEVDSNTQKSQPLVNWIRIQFDWPLEKSKEAIEAGRVIWAGKTRLDPNQVIPAEHWATHPCVVLPATASGQTVVKPQLSKPTSSSSVIPAPALPPATAPALASASTAPPVVSEPVPPFEALDLYRILLKSRLALTKDHARYLVQMNRVLYDGNPITRFPNNGMAFALSVKPVVEDARLSHAEQSLLEYSRELANFVRSSGRSVWKSAILSTHFLKTPTGAAVSERIKNVCANSVAVIEFGKRFGLSVVWSDQTVLEIHFSQPMISEDSDVAAAMRVAMRGLQRSAPGLLKRPVVTSTTPEQPLLRATPRAPIKLMGDALAGESVLAPVPTNRVGSAPMPKLKHVEPASESPPSTGVLGGLNQVRPNQPTSVEIPVGRGSGPLLKQAPAPPLSSGGSLLQHQPVGGTALFSARDTVTVGAPRPFSSSVQLPSLRSASPANVVPPAPQLSPKLGPTPMQQQHQPQPLPQVPQKPTAALATLLLKPMQVQSSPAKESLPAQQLATQNPPSSSLVSLDAATTIGSAGEKVPAAKQSASSSPSSSSPSSSSAAAAALNEATAREKQKPAATSSDFLSSPALPQPSPAEINSLVSALVTRKLALNAEDARNLIANVMVKIDGAEAKSDTVRVSEDSLIELNSDLLKMRRVLPQAFLPAQDAFSWPNLKQKQVLWALASVSCFASNLGLEALKVGLVVPPQEQVSGDDARCTQAIMSLFLDPGPVFLACKGVLTGVSRIIIERAAQRAVSMLSNTPSVYRRLPMEPERLIVGPTSEFFWPLIGAYNKPEDADAFLSKIFDPAQNAWASGTGDATEDAILSCLLDLPDFCHRVRPSAAPYILSAKIAPGASKFAHRTRLSRLCEELRGSLWERGMRSILVSVQTGAA